MDETTRLRYVRTACYVSVIKPHVLCKSLLIYECVYWFRAQLVFQMASRGCNRKYLSKINNINDDVREQKHIFFFFFDRSKRVPFDSNEILTHLHMSQFILSHSGKVKKNYFSLFFRQTFTCIYFI